MTKNTKTVSCVFIAFCLLFAGDILFAATPPGCGPGLKGNVEYMPDGDCGTKKRECCYDGHFSEWGQPCPAEVKFKAVQRRRYTYVMPCSGNKNCPVQIIKGYPSYVKWFSDAALKNCSDRKTEAECKAGYYSESQSYYCNYGYSSSCEVPDVRGPNLYTLPECIGVSQSAATEKCKSEGAGDLCIYEYGYNGRIPQTIMYMNCRWTYDFQYNDSRMKCDVANYSFQEYPTKLATTREATVYECVEE